MPDKPAMVSLTAIELDAVREALLHTEFSIETDYYPARAKLAPALRRARKKIEEAMPPQPYLAYGGRGRSSTREEAPPHA